MFLSFNINTICSLNKVNRTEHDRTEHDRTWQNRVHYITFSTVHVYPPPSLFVIITQILIYIIYSRTWSGTFKIKAIKWLLMFKCYLMFHASFCISLNYILLFNSFTVDSGFKYIIIDYISWILERHMISLLIKYNYSICVIQHHKGSPICNIIYGFSIIGSLETSKNGMVHSGARSRVWTSQWWWT